jgi:nucleotide-binding universal stress UspA family protein
VPRSPMKQILLPVDFSQQSSLVVPYVRAYAHHLNSKITLISAVPAIWTSAPAGVGTHAPANAAALEIEFKNRLEKWAGSQFDGLPVEIVVRSGDPARLIIDYTHENAVDLVMMPTHGASAFRSLLIGSVASKILHDADCPVWTATHAKTQEARVFPRTILCAVDDTPRSGTLMRWADQFSRECGAELKLLHVVLPVGDWLALPGERALADQVRKEARAKIDAQRDVNGIRAPLRIAQGDIAKTVAEEARQEDADLLIIARGSAKKERLRAHAYSIIHHSPCPVLSV